MNSITALKVAGLSEAAGTIARGVGKGFEISGGLGRDLGSLLSGGHWLGKGVGQAAGYVAPVLVANYAANQFAPTRRAKVWLGEKAVAGGNVLGRALVPSDFGARAGDYPGG